MSRLSQDTSQRMREAFTIEMSPATQRAHSSSIGDALNTAESAQPRTSTSWWQTRIPALGAALLVILPVGTAIAAESAAPGDFLYPIKRVAEPVRSIVDSDVVARHRVDELQRFLDEPAVSDRLSDALRDARDAVSDLPIDHDLRVAFDRLTDRVTDKPPLDKPPSDVAPHTELDETPSTDVDETPTGTDRRQADVPAAPDEPEQHPHEPDARPDEPHEEQDTRDTSKTREDEPPQSDR